MSNWHFFFFFDQEKNVELEKILKFDIIIVKEKEKMSNYRFKKEKTSKSNIKKEKMSNSKLKRKNVECFSCRSTL